MRYFISAFLLASFLLINGWANAQQKLTVVADEWPPFSGEALPNQGISVDVITAVLRRAGYEAEGQILPWARIVAGAKAGEYDIVGSLFRDAEMERSLAYGDAYFETSIRFLRRAGSNATYSDLASLAPYSIAVGTGFLYEEGFDNTRDLNKVEVTTTLQGVRMVAYDRVDLTLDSVEVIDHAVSTQDPGLADRIEFVGPPIATQTMHMAVSREVPNHQQIVTDYNRVLGEMREDGSLEKLLAKHTSQ